jgi:hypothetical protein
MRIPHESIAAMLVIALLLSAPAQAPAATATTVATEVTVPPGGHARTADPNCIGGPPEAQFDANARCVEMRLDLPANATVVSFRGFAREQGAGSFTECHKHPSNKFFDCIPFMRLGGRFIEPGAADPKITSTSSGKSVIWIARNHSADRTRQARMEVTFSVP